MKKHWLRGLLLGVSLALLLSGGVALAAPRVSIEPWCGVCCDAPLITVDEQVSQLPMCDDFLSITSSGWAAFEHLDITISPPGPRPSIEFGAFADENRHMVGLVYLMCWRGNDRAQALVDGYDFALIWADDWTEDDYGEWTVLVEDGAGAVEGNFLFAEDPSDCQVEEFVPEPGSILLLGSGLAGLAGYATLRWRARE